MTVIMSILIKTIGICLHTLFYLFCYLIHHEKNSIQRRRIDRVQLNQKGKIGAGLN